MNYYIIIIIYVCVHMCMRTHIMWGGLRTTFRIWFSFSSMDSRNWTQVYVTFVFPVIMVPVTHMVNAAAWLYLNLCELSNSFPMCYAFWLIFLSVNPHRLSSPCQAPNRLNRCWEKQMPSWSPTFVSSLITAWYITHGIHVSKSSEHRLLWK